MDHLKRPQTKEHAPATTTPKAGERVVVRCQGFTCLAYRDSKGIWRADKDDSQLPEVLEVIFRF